MVGDLERHGGDDDLTRAYARDPEIRALTEYRTPADPQAHLIMRAIAVGDAMARLFVALVVLLVVWVWLAVAVSPWFWAGAVATVGYGVATVVWMRRQRRHHDDTGRPRLTRL